MDEYDRWYRSYQRRRRIAAGIGYFLAGIGVGLAVYTALVIALSVFG